MQQLGKIIYTNTSSFSMSRMCTNYNKNNIKCYTENIIDYLYVI